MVKVTSIVIALGIVIGKVTKKPKLGAAIAIGPVVLAALKILAETMKLGPFAGVGNYPIGLTTIEPYRQELQGALGIAQPSVSKHLKILEEAGLVDYRKEGLWVNYYLADGKSSPYAASLLGNLRHWLNEDPEVSELMKIVPYLNREELCKR